MRICVLSSSYQRSDSPFSAVDSPSDPSRWLPEHTWEHHLLDKATAVQRVQRLVREGFDVFVNLCDGAWHEDTGSAIVSMLLLLSCSPRRWSSPYRSSSSTPSRSTPQPS